MTIKKVAEQLKSSLQESLHVEAVIGDTIQTLVTGENLPAVIRVLREDFGARFITSVGIDKRELTGCYDVNQLFALDPEKIFLVIRTEVDPARAEIPSITSIIPGANWAEREVRDMVGVIPIGHPDPRRLVLPDDWPDNVYPLRKDFNFNEHPQKIPSRRPDIKPPPKDATILPIGPFFPTLEEPVFINLYVHGEQIVGMDYRGFYGHRGIEKMADAELTYQQVPFIAERICGI